MAEWDVSKIAQALQDYKGKAVNNSGQGEVKITTEDIRKALKELGKKEESPNEKTFVDFDDGAVPMPSDKEIEKIMKKLERKGINPEIAISYVDKETGIKQAPPLSYLNQEDGDARMTTMATNEEGDDARMTTMAVNEEGGSMITMATNEEGDDARMTTMAVNEEGGSDNELPGIRGPLTLALNEGGDARMTTMAINEEGGGANISN